ncbi:MAG: YitT family protein [Ruminococcaceae bacterium]|nr:YitT family protein [Oscillospiraceae bacterium]
MEPNTKKSVLKRNAKTANIISHIFTLLAASLLFSVALNMFFVPQEIVIGGATGISTVLNILFNTPIGIVIILINVPLVLINWYIFGFKFVIKTIIGIATSSIITDLLFFLPPLTEDRLLAALFGGICMGAGLGLFFSKGYTTGGTDLISCLLKKRFPTFSNATFIFIVDMAVVLASSIVLKDFNDVFYSLIAILVASACIDVVISGINRAMLAIIITDKAEEVSSMILTELNRGTTLLTGKGGFTHKDKQVIMCVVKKSQIYDLKSSVNRISPESFMILSSAAEVRGVGFESEAL